jgi:hypothetical protein
VRTYASVILLASALLAGRASAGQPAEASWPLSLGDEEYWGNVERTRDAVVAEIGKRNFQGILLGAPGRVPIATRQTLPVAGYFVRSLRDDRVLDQERQMIVVAVNQANGRSYTGLALASGKQPAAPADTGEDPGEGTTLNLFTCDLRRTLGLPWEPASYRVTMLLGRFVSNSVVVELVGAPGANVTASPVGNPSIQLVRKGKSGCQVAGRLLPPGDGPTKVLVLATGARTAGPWTVAVDVPAASKTKQRQTAGAFAVDLLRAPDVPKGTQPYFVYAFGAGGAAGPVTCPAGRR